MTDFLIAGVLGYILGAVPTGVILCRLLGTPDVRYSGSGHTGALNVSRSAGLWPSATTVVVDTLLGLGATTGAALLTDNPWAVIVAGVLAVVGHNWSVFIGFGGGIGLTTLFGSLLHFAPLTVLGAAVADGLFWVILVKVFKVHSARARIVMLALVGPLLWALNLSWPAVLLGVLGSAVAIVKTLPDWNRVYG